MFRAVEIMSAEMAAMVGADAIWLKWVSVAKHSFPLSRKRWKNVFGVKIRRRTRDIVGAWNPLSNRLESVLFD